MPVLAFTTLFAWYLLPPAALLEFGQSLFAFMAFASNWFFWINVGYFDGPAQLKPLLHTWSLSIEEQFYVLFPIPILLARRVGLRAVGALLTAVFVLSLGYSTYLVWAGAADTAFYNSFARFWEIALGGMIAMGVISAPKASAARQVSGLIGLGAIITSMLAFNGIPFPGLWALVPTAGTALVILAKDSIANRMLAWPPMVAVGLISYALYLWHWPIFVFIEFTILGAGQLHFMVGTAIAVVLATASYFFLEKPIRQRKALDSIVSVSVAFAASLIVFAGAGVTLWRLEGAPHRFPLATEYTTDLAVTVYEVATARLRSVCWLGSEEELAPAIKRCIHPDEGKPRVLLIGDSHAAQFYPAFGAAMPDATISLLATDSCTLRPGDRGACNELTAWIDEKSRDGSLPFDLVVVSSRLATVALAEILSATLERISERGFPVTLLGPIQYYSPNLPTLFPTLAGTMGKTQMLQNFTEAVQPHQFQVDTYLRGRLSLSDVQYISLLDVTCPMGPESCEHLDPDGRPVTIDDSHLSAQAAQAIVDIIAPQIVRRR